MRREFNVLALIKDDERYVYVYDDGGLAQLVDAFRDQAADPRVSLNWFDASVLTRKAREQAQAQPEPVDNPRVHDRIREAQ